MILGAVLLLVVAAAFVAAELFLPTHGVLGVLAALAAVASVVMAYRVAPALGLLFGIVIAILSPVVFYWAVRIYPQTPVGKRVMLSAEPGTGFEKQAASLGELVGKHGVAMTMLRPAGSVELEGKRIDAMSEAELIEAGTKVEVIRVSGLNVIVKAVG